MVRRFLATTDDSRATPSTVPVHVLLNHLPILILSPLFRLLFRMRIEQLQTYRQQGITTLAEGAMYEAHKRKAQEGVRIMSPGGGA